MSKKQSKEDVNQAAARVIGEWMRNQIDALPDDVEKAWEVWSAGLGKINGRALLLLRAAFEAGIDAAKASKGK